MLRSLNEIIGYSLLAEDGEIGKCKDFLFDDRWFTIRYLLVDTGGWLKNRKVLVSPVFVAEIDWTLRKIVIHMTQTEIENSPPLEEDEPVSIQYEREFFDFFGYPYYWTGERMWGMFPTPLMINRNQDNKQNFEAQETRENHLRSVKEVRGYSIAASDGDIGRIEDVIINDENYALIYIVVDTRKWLPGGKKVLLATNWIDDIDWVQARITVDLTKDKIKNSPEFNPHEPVNYEYKIRLYDYYGKPLDN